MGLAGHTKPHSQLSRFLSIWKELFCGFSDFEICEGTSWVLFHILRFFEQWTVDSGQWTHTVHILSYVIVHIILEEIFSLICPGI